MLNFSSKSPFEDLLLVHSCKKKKYTLWSMITNTKYWNTLLCNVHFKSCWVVWSRWVKGWRKKEECTMLGGEGALRLTQSLRGVSQKTIHFPIIWKTFGIITCMLHKIENCSHAHHFPCSPNQCHHWANILGIKIGARRSLYKIGLQHCCRNNILVRGDGTFPWRQHLRCYLQLLKLDFTALRDFECQQRDAPGCDLILFTLSSSLEFRQIKSVSLQRKAFPPSDSELEGWQVENL